jgi:hypothetical protein
MPFHSSVYILHNIFFRVPLVRLVPQDFVDFQELVEAQVIREILVLLVLQVKHFIYFIYLTMF